MKSRAKGVSYFSSAGNRPATQAYDSKVRIVPGVAASWAGHEPEFRERSARRCMPAASTTSTRAAALDIAQTIQFAAGSTFVFQWNEPFDPHAADAGRSADRCGRRARCRRTVTTSFTFNGTAGQLVEIFVDADNTTTGTPNPDLTFALLDPNGDEIQFVDTGTNPESLTLELPLDGHVHGRRRQLPCRRSSATSCIACRRSKSSSRCCRDYNLLFFLPNGTFIGALAEQNLFTNRPLEIGGIPGSDAADGHCACQHARREEPQRRGPHPLRRLQRRESAGVLQLSRSGDVRSQLGGRRHGRRGLCVLRAVRARERSPRRDRRRSTSTRTTSASSIRRSGRSRTWRRWTAPTRRSSCSDSSTDPDTFPNFFGTSAAAPHAAAIAALVLDAAGGPGTVKPKKMREILQDSAFRHDLDPYFSSGFALVAR